MEWERNSKKGWNNSTNSMEWKTGLSLSWIHVALNDARPITKPATLHPEEPDPEEPAMPKRRPFPKGLSASPRDQSVVHFFARKIKTGVFDLDDRDEDKTTDVSSAEFTAATVAGFLFQQKLYIFSGDEVTYKERADAIATIEAALRDHLLRCGRRHNFKRLD
jgi:hypothetical protein